MTELVTYLNKPDLKLAFLGELAKHEAQDAFIKGTYGRMNGYFKGCGIGCSLHSLNVMQGKDAMYQTGNHDRVPAELGWPLWLAYAEDNIFENLPDDLAKSWPRRLAEAIPVGIVVPDIVLAKLLRWVLLDSRFGVFHATDDESVKTVVRTMGALFDRTIDGQTVPNEAEWDEAARAARAAWDARAARAAWDARAAWAAWAARDAWDARAAYYPALSEEVLRRLSELEPAAA